MEIRDYATLASGLISFGALIVALIANRRSKLADLRSQEAHKWARETRERESSEREHARLVRARAEEIVRELIEAADEHRQKAGTPFWDLNYRDDLDREAVRLLVGDPRLKSVEFLKDGFRVSIEPPWP
jgi:hypothetical protein